MSLYPYTLKPVDINISSDEFLNAQTELFKQSMPSFGIKTIKMKEWLFMAIALAIGISGIILVSGYSTIIFWVLLVGVVIYLAARTLGMKWYVEKEFDKQLAQMEMPDELTYLKLGVQKQGIIISMPTTKNPNLQNNANKAMKGMQMRMPSMQQAVINWNTITGWDETNDFVFIMFEMQGQKGSQIVPKRLQVENFPIDTVIKHLKEVKEKGIDMAAMAQS